MKEIFRDEMKKLNGRFNEMGIDISEQIYQATKSFVDHDQQLAEQIINQDETINDNEISLEERALKLIALQQPVARDFRKIISILKASSDLERIGDHAIIIARETIRLKGNNRIPEVEELISDLTADIRSMLEQSLDASIRGDAEMAKKIAQSDQEVDEQYYQIYQLLIEIMKRETNTAVAATSYLMVIRMLERIGDHIVNLCEWVLYDETGKLKELNPGKLHRDEYLKVEEQEAIVRHERKKAKLKKEANKE
ncbi:MAG TPA: phosphate signaling complex protein PhoU [Candidatus Ligilactobacillus excrementigallinarum]|uniref:Phosphate-specific transport system accessory protein PhoU n=1 Tax=Candidatus Ligilactobacillus excrementigallinarum TaxID=2838641 RepID=A0A9D2AA60_9LACO|nr:phosphate signaling complex protein PhoU [Candidatus Ligilactobacillus excrementigallinarum]